MAGGGGDWPISEDYVLRSPVIQKPFQRKSAPTSIVSRVETSCRVRCGASLKRLRASEPHKKITVHFFVVSVRHKRTRPVRYRTLFSRKKKRCKQEEAGPLLFEKPREPSYRSPAWNAPCPRQQTTYRLDQYTCMSCWGSRAVLLLFVAARDCAFSNVDQPLTYPE